MCFLFNAIIDVCSCSCKSAYSVQMSDVTSQTICSQRCDAENWCVMYSFVSFSESECILYSSSRPCATCSSVLECESGCVGRYAYKKENCNAYMATEEASSNAASFFPALPSSLATGSRDGPFESRRCTLDFLSVDAWSQDGYAEGPDGLLTTEFSLLEMYAEQSASSDSATDYWCDAASRPSLLCLDIGAPSTMGDYTNFSSLDSLLNMDSGNNLLIYRIHETRNLSSHRLFGQVQPCSGQVVGDGLINVFDMSALLSYVFGDWIYGSLPTSPSTVHTVDRRHLSPSLVLPCSGNGTAPSRSAYMRDYVRDPCLHIDSSSSDQSSDARRRALEDVSSEEGEGGDVNIRVLHGRGVWVRPPVFLLFLSLTCPFSPDDTRSCFEADAISSSFSVGRVYFHARGVAVSRAHRGRREDAVYLPFRRGVRFVDVDETRTVAYSDMSTKYTSVRVWKEEGTAEEEMWRDGITTVFDVMNDSPEKEELPKADMRSLSVSSLVVGGKWTTFSFPGTPARMYAFMRGVTDVRFSTQQWNMLDTPEREEMRISLRCECIKCPSVQSSFSDGMGILNGTMNLFQIPVLSSCPLNVHIFTGVGKTPTLSLLVTTDISAYEQPHWTQESCIERSVVTTHVTTVPPPPDTPPPPSPLHNTRTEHPLSIFLMIGAILTVICFIACVLTYAILPYPFCPTRCCKSCGRSSTLKNYFKGDVCRRCQWIHDHTGNLSHGQGIKLPPVPSPSPGVVVVSPPKV